MAATHPVTGLVLVS